MQKKRETRTRAPRGVNNISFARVLHCKGGYLKNVLFYAIMIENVDSLLLKEGSYENNQNRD